MAKFVAENGILVIRSAKGERTPEVMYPRLDRLIRAG
jgi:hypothetical protein